MNLLRLALDPYRSPQKARVNASKTIPRRRVSNGGCGRDDPAALVWLPPKYVMVLLTSGSPAACGFGLDDFTLQSEKANGC